MGFCISAALSVLVLVIRGWWTLSGSLCTERMILARDGGGDVCVYIPLRAASRKLFGKSRVSMGKEANDIISVAYCGRAYKKIEEVRDLCVDLDMN